MDTYTGNIASVGYEGSTKEGGKIESIGYDTVERFDVIINT